MSNKIPTAKEFLAKWLVENKVDVHGAMIAYAKLHVKAALEAAANDTEYVFNDTEYVFTSHCKSTILNAYPENLIV